MPEATLIVIDVQRAFDDPGWGQRNNPAVEARVADLLAAWRSVAAPLVHVRHRFRGGDRFAYKPEAESRQGELEVFKTVHSAFIGTNLEQLLRDAGAETIAIAGLTTDHCCSTTARMASDLGFDVWFIADATATFARGAFDAETMHQSALASLNGEFADVIDTATAVARLRNERAS